MFRREQAYPGNLIEVTAEGETRAICDSGTCHHGYAIGPVSGYAVGAIAGPVGGPFPERNAVARVLDARAQIEQFGIAAATDDARTDFCLPIPVRSYKSGGMLNQPVGLFLTLCREIASGDAIPPIRIVNKDYAGRRFETALNGAFYRRFGENGSVIEECVVPGCACAVTG